MTAEDQLHSEMCDLIAGIGEGLTAGEVATAICSLVREKMWPDAPAGDALTAALRLTEWLRNLAPAIDWSEPHGTSSVVVQHIAEELRGARAEGAAEEREAVRPMIDRGLAAAEEHAEGYKRGLAVSENLVAGLRSRIDEAFRWYDVARSPSSGTEAP